MRHGINDCAECSLPQQCQDLQEQLDSHCLSTSWQRDDILRRVARERGWDEGRLVEILDRILTEHEASVDEAERLLEEYRNLRAAVRPMMEDAARCAEEFFALRVQRDEMAARLSAVERENKRLREINYNPGLGSF